MAVGLLCVVLGATAQTSYAQPAPITDFSTYPPALPDTCTVDGPAVIQGAVYSVDGQSSSDLNALVVEPGDVVTMTWDSFTPGCETVGIGLSVKIAYDTTFDPNDDQYLADFGYCGPEGPLCVAPYQLQVQLLPAATAPCWQVDAHLGPPLSVVGPSGAYYGLNSAQNMLISANNGGTTPCTPEPCPENPAVPAGSMECQPVTPTTASPTTTAAPPPTVAPDTTPTSAAVSPATSPPAVVCGSGEVLDAATGECIAQSSVNVLGARQTIPVTGSSNGNLLLAALGLVLFGGSALLFGRRPATSR
jgi:LPXTG-motif cell wall-anchored protein